MKRTIASILAASALAAAGAAGAQSLDDRIDRLEERVDHSVDQSLLTDYQAQVFRNQLQGVRDQRDRLQNSGELSLARARDLDRRLDRLAYRLGRDEYYTRNGTYRGYYRGWNADEDYNPSYPYSPPNPY
jgi:hypothetical protein